MGSILLTTSDLFFSIMILLILGRVILSWLPQYRYSQIGEVIFSVTDPIMRPIQRMVPPAGMFDFSPMIAFVVLIIAQQIIDGLIRAIFYIP